MTEMLNKKDIIPLIDLTLLDTGATREDISNLAKKAEKYKVAAICIFPLHLQYLPDLETVKIATVANFPRGLIPSKEQLSSVKQLCRSRIIDELDFVLPYHEYQNNNKNQAIDIAKNYVDMCKEHNITSKVILETGSFLDTNEIYDVSIDMINLGVDFLKTSTGKITKGASISAVDSMLNARTDLNSKVGIKISGGIKVYSQALDYINLVEGKTKNKVNNSWFRIGASTLLDDLVNK